MKDDINPPPPQLPDELLVSEVMVRADNVRGVTLSDAGTNKDRLGLTFHLHGDPDGLSKVMYVLTFETAHDLHEKLQSVCPHC